MFSRSGEWPPDASDADLIVNATPVRDELLVGRAQGRRWSTSPTAPTAARPRSSRPPGPPGCEVVDGYEALVRQGAASFQLWTGRPAPVEAMRSALGLAP